MDEFVRIDDKSYRADTSMSWMIRFENAFHEDAFSAVQVLLGNDMERIVETTLGVFWAMTGETPDIAERLPEILTQLAPIVTRSIGNKSKDKPKQSNSTSESMTVMQTLASGIKRGLTLTDTHELTFGSWLEYCSEFNKLSGLTVQAEEAAREATQADIDRFING